MSTTESAQWYRLKDEATIDSPSLVFYLGRVDVNIAKCITMAGSTERLRPHTKTCKSSMILQKMRTAGISKFKCATIAEAELLGEVGAHDVLLAYQLTQTKARRWISLIQKFPATDFATVIDNLASAEVLSELAINIGLSLRIYLDLNVGMNRTGIVPSEALSLYQQVKELPNLSLQGLHAYDGHIHDASLTMREQQVADAFAPVDRLRQAIINAGLPKPGLIAGGSSSFPMHLQRLDQECSPGTFVFWDAGYAEHYPEQPFQPAALILTRVISIPTEGYYCIDLGYKSIAAEMAMDKRARFPGLEDARIISHSEEHMVITTSSPLEIGEAVYALPYHICPTVAMYDSALLVEDGNVTRTCPIEARNRIITI